MTYAFAAAGTGGHVYPAIATAEALIDAGVSRSDIVFFGGDRMEVDAVPAAGFAFVPLEIRGFKRSMSTDNLRLPKMVRSAGRHVAEEMAARRVRVVTVFGGYVTGPAVLGARRQGAGIIVHEGNAVPGVAHRLARRSAARTLVAFAAAADRLRGAELVGNPLRAPIAGYDRAHLRAEAHSHYRIDGDRPVLGVFGGSQGALALNEFVSEFLRTSAADVTVVHLTGQGILPEITDPRWRARPFEDRMELFYAAVDLAVSRAGAMTMSELAATATPAIVVPLPAGRGYQAANAADLSAAGGAIVIDQDRLGEVGPIIDEILSDRVALDRMAKGAESVGHPNAAAVVAAAMQEVAGA